MPRLLNVNNYHYRRGGAEVVYLEHGHMFAGLGWDVDWFSMKHPSNPVGTDETYFAELIDMEHMRGAAAKLRAVPPIIYNEGARRRIGALVAARRPNIAHLHNIYHHLSPSILVELKRRGVPTVLTAHDLKLACPSYKMLSRSQVCERCKGGRVWNLALRRCLKDNALLSGVVTVESAVHKMLGLYSKNIDRIVAPSRFYREKLIEWGWEPARIVHVPNFIRDLSSEAPTGTGGGPVLYFGRLSEEKGIGTLLRASARSGVKIRIAGTGPREAELKALAATLQAPAEFLGHISGTALQTVIQEASAIVLPSEWYENSPMSVLEAYAAGRPVAGADIGGIPELIRAGETGWIFPSGDPDALADVLAAIASTPRETLDALGQEGRALVSQTFRAERYVERMTELYTGLT